MARMNQMLRANLVNIRNQAALSRVVRWPSIGAACFGLFGLTSCLTDKAASNPNPPAPAPAPAPADAPTAPATPPAPEVREEPKQVKFERMPFDGLEVRQLSCQISTPLMGDSDLLLKAIEADSALPLAVFKFQLDKMKKCVRGNAAAKLTFETTKLSQPSVPAKEQKIGRTVEKVAVGKSTAGIKNACLVSALVGTKTLFEGSCEAVLLFGKAKLAEEAAIALLGKEALISAETEATTAVMKDSPAAKYLAQANPQDVLALIGKPVDSPEVKKFLAPLDAAGLREDLDLVGNLMFRPVGLRVHYEDNKVADIMFVYMDNDAYPGSLPFGFKYPAHGADIMKKLGKPEVVEPFSALFTYKKYKIQVIFNDDDPAIFAKSEISGLRFVPISAN